MKCVTLSAMILQLKTKERNKEILVSLISKQCIFTFLPKLHILNFLIWYLFSLYMLHILSGSME